MGSEDKGEKKSFKLHSSVLFFTSLGHFSHIRIFLYPPFAGISVFVWLTSKLNAVSLKDKDSKEPPLCKRADAKIINK